MIRACCLKPNVWTLIYRSSLAIPHQNPHTRTKKHLKKTFTRFVNSRSTLSASIKSSLPLQKPLFSKHCFTVKGKTSF